MIDDGFSLDSRRVAWARAQIEKLEREIDQYECEISYLIRRRDDLESFVKMLARSKIVIAGDLVEEEIGRRRQLQRVVWALQARARQIEEAMNR